MAPGAGKFRSRLSGNGDGAQGAAAVAQPARRGAARRRRPGQFPRPPAQRGGRNRAAQGYADRARHRPRRARRLADRPYAALRRLCPRRRGSGDLERLDGPPIIGARRVTDPVAAYYVTDILRGAPPPPNSLSGRIAFKTGTSYGFRDALAVGFDKGTTIGVWVGRPDNGPTPGLIGRAGGGADPVRRLRATGARSRADRPPKGVLRVRFPRSCRRR